MEEFPKETIEATRRKYSAPRKPAAQKKEDPPLLVLGKRQRKPRVRLGEEASPEPSDEEPVTEQEKKSVRPRATRKTTA